MVSAWAATAGRDRIVRWCHYRRALARDDWLGLRYGRVRSCGKSHPLHLSHGIRIHAGGWVEDHTWRGGFVLGIPNAQHFLKHAIDATNMEFLMPVRTNLD
jgi:hypothetical protein